MTLGELKQLVGERPFLWEWPATHIISTSQFIGQTELVHHRDNDEETKIYTHSITNDSELKEFKLISYFEETVDLKCECGAESIGVGTHSHWCGKASVA